MTDPGDLHLVLCTKGNCTGKSGHASAHTGWTFYRNHPPTRSIILTEPCDFGASV